MRMQKMRFNIFFAALIILFFTSQSHGFFGPHYKEEKRGLDYKSYLNLTRSTELPPDSRDIDYAFVYLGDTWYEFIQAKINKNNLILSKIVGQSIEPRGDNPIKITNAHFDIQAFKKTFDFGSGELELPSWWFDNLDKDFKINYLLVGYYKGYGYGCWAFFDAKNGILRVFKWSQQHLSLENFQRNFGISK